MAVEVTDPRLTSKRKAHDVIAGSYLDKEETTFFISLRQMRRLSMPITTREVKCLVERDETWYVSRYGGGAACMQPVITNKSPTRRSCTASRVIFFLAGNVRMPRRMD